MLWIIILGLIAKLVLVSGDCDFGNLSVSDFDWNKFSGNEPWHWFLHTPTDFDNKLNCLECTFASSKGEPSLLTAKAYDISDKRPVTLHGYSANWNSTGYFDVYHSVAIWSGAYYVVAVDYDRYVILKVCPFESEKVSVYVGYRCDHPDKSTVKDAEKALQDNNIDVNQLVPFPRNHCEEVESSTAG